MNQRLNNPGLAHSGSGSSSGSVSSSDARLDASLSSPSPPISSSSSSSSSQTEQKRPEGTPKPPKRKFSMAAIDNASYEPVRVPRPEGVPQWGGGGGGEDAPLKGSRKEDRWV